MPSTLDIHRNQSMFFVLDNYVPQDHTVRVIDSLVNSIDKKYKLFSDGNIFSTKLGRKSYPMQSMLKLLIYGYMSGITSSRKLENACKENLSLIWLIESITPNFRTICNFRINYAKQIEKFFNYFVNSLIQAGYANPELVITDGVRIKGNVSKPSKTEKEINEYEVEIKKQLNEWMSLLEKHDNEEICDYNYQQTKALTGDISAEDTVIDNPSTTEKVLSDSEDTENQKDTQKEQDVSKIKRKIRHLKAKLENIKIAKNRFKTTEIKYINLTDPEASRLNNHGHKYPGYNFQYTTESDNTFIVGFRPSSNPNDYNELVPTVEDLIDNLQVKPKRIVGDKGFSSFDQIKKTEDEIGIDVVVELKKSTSKLKDFFIYDAETDLYTCKNNKQLKFHRNKAGKNGRKYFVYKCKECKGCEFRKDCTDSKHGREVLRAVDYERELEYSKKMEQEDYQYLIQRRRVYIEYVFSPIRDRMGFIPLLLRGLEKVKIEGLLYAIGFNITKLQNLFKGKSLKKFFDFIIKNLCLFVRILVKMFKYKATIWQYLLFIED